MHTLIPRFIHEQYVAGRENGRFPAVTLLLDIAGFTAMTQKLVPYGKEGAEVMADMVNRLFAPIITILHQHGGFVTLFAGDALTVVFPRHDAATALAACRAALAIGRIFARQRLQTTRLGDFALMVKQGLSAGDVAWGIVGPAAHKTYFFRGAAIAGCAHAEHRAQGGDIVVDARLQALLPPAAVLQPLDAQYARLLGLAETAVAAENPGQLPPLDPDVAGRFFAPALWQMPQLGEFRYVVTLFIAFQGANDFAGLNQFITQVTHLADRFDGFFVELDFGDKGDFFIVYFGAPVAHENDVRRGLNFVLALRAALADTPIAWRAGVTSGVVYAGYVGSPLRDKYACVGSVVNLAARLMMHAAWGEVLVAGDVARHPGFDFTPLGDVAYKGFAQGVPTYRLQGKTAAERNFSHELVGREAEMRRLLTFTQPLFVGQQAGVAVVYGEAGIGKSHFTYAFSQVLGTRVRWLTGQCDSILREPFNPFVYFLRRYFGQAAGAAAAENEASFQRRFDALLVALASIPGARRQYDELRRTRPFLGALLGLHWPDSLYERLDAQGRYQNTVTALSMLLQAECRRQPVVLELEDGHWLDDASRAFLPLLARQAADLPLLILVTSRYSDSGARPDYRLPPEVPRLEIALPALAPAALRDLAQNVLDMPIDAHLHRLLLEKTDANPLFVQQIVYYLKENRLLTVTAGAGQQMAALAGRDFDLPRTLNTLLVARLDRLTPEVKEVVQTAAVLGREFESRLLAHMLQRDLSAELQQAEHEQIWTMLNAVKYMFRHVLLRDAAYEMQLRTRLR
ncbi:MAG: AAA family ATPase, partial [Anaerolineales bacterium]|nr:AAA family ATPase [Anaerolineales bacterium]